MSEMRPTCLHNPSTGHERELPHEVERAAEKCRVLVAGGGPGGLEAARVCAERGHEVRLVEASGALGGQVLLAVQAHWRRDLIGVVDWRVAELEALGVEVQLNRYLEPEEAGAEDADVVIVATGGIPDLEWIDGTEHCTNVVGRSRRRREPGRRGRRLRRDRASRRPHCGGEAPPLRVRGDLLRPRRSARDGDVLRRAGHLAKAKLRAGHRAAARSPS